MPKGKGTGEGTTDILEELETGENGGGSAQAEVAVRGKGKTVGDALKKAGLKDAAREVKGSFNELLKNPKNKILAARIFPKQTRGPDGKMRDCADVVDMPPPMSLDEITRHLQEEYGGKKWNVRVQDEDGEVLDAKNIDVPGEVKLVARPEDEFSIPGSEELSGIGGEGGNGVQEEPLDREIVTKEKEGKALLLEQQNARLRAQISDLTNAQKKPEVDVTKIVADALAAQEAKHRAELAERDKRQEMSEMERRINDSVKAQMDAMRMSLDKLAAGNPAQSTGMTELAHKIEMIQTSLDNKIDKALGSYREMTNQQINALEKGVDSKLSAIQTSLASIQHQKPDSSIKDVIPLITSSIERSTSGYKEMVGPVIKMLTEKQEAEAAPPESPLEQTLETLGKFNLLGDKKSGDFGSRVVDFAEKMGPEIFAFIRDERNKGRDVTEQTLKNHLKLQAEKISREVSAAAAQEIKKIRSEQQQRGLPAPAATTKSHQGQVGPSPVGNMSPEEVAARQRKEAAPAPAAPAAAAPAPAAPPPQPSSPAAAPRMQQRDPEPEQEEEQEEEEEPMTVEEEMAARVNSTLELLEREMRIRPRQVTWPNAAWDDLPAEVLDQIIFANDEEDVYKAIEPHADKALSERIWNLVRSDPAKKDFIVNGINIIKGWALELQEKQRAAAGDAPPAEPPPQQ